MSSVLRNGCRGLVATVLVLISATSAIAANQEGTMPAECEGVADSEAVHRLQRESIDDVKQLREESDSVFDQNFGRGRLIGATVSVLPIRGLTRERLQRVLECGFKLASTEGASTDWPRLPAGTTIRVHSGGDRFLVDLKSANDASAEQLFQAALAYKPRS